MIVAIFKLCIGLLVGLVTLMVGYEVLVYLALAAMSVLQH
jgi:hypothetical protein